MSGLEGLLAYLCKFNFEIVLFGDFNVNFLKRTPERCGLVDLCGSFNLSYHVQSATRVTAETSTCLDNMFTSISENEFVLNVFDPMLSDHCAISMEYTVAKTRTFGTRLMRNTKQENLNNLLMCLEDTDWSSISTIYSASGAFECFFHIFIDVYNKTCEQITSKIVNNYPKPNWFNVELQRARDQLAALQTIFAVTKTKESEQMYKQYRAEYRRMIRMQKAKHNKNLIESSENRIRAAWKLINSTVSLKKKQCPNEQLDPEELNDFFTSIPIETMRDIPQANATPKEYFQKLRLGGGGSSLFLYPTDKCEVEHTIAGLKLSNCEDIYGLTSNTIKLVSKIISEPLSAVINKCLFQGIFPNELKIARVIPLHKKGDHANMNNYRPVSILPVFSKIFEKIVLKRLVGYLDAANILCEEQYGYRKSRSTVKAIAALLEEVFAGMDGSAKSSAVFLDLTKAFDCVVTKY